MTHTTQPSLPITNHNTTHRLQDGFPLTAAQPTNITAKTTCYSYVGVAPKRTVRACVDTYMHHESCPPINNRSIDRYSHH